MTAQMVLALGQDALWMLLMISAPILGIVLVVGLLISLFQAVTQINESTLAFVPKLVAAVAMFALSGPWMLTTLVDYIRRIFEGLPAAVL
ncbi:MAG: flagellar biosynthesis protein FliQ [Rhodoferax sp.]